MKRSYVDAAMLPIDKVLWCTRQGSGNWGLIVLQRRGGRVARNARWYRRVRRNASTAFNLGAKRIFMEATMRPRVFQPTAVWVGGELHFKRRVCVDETGRICLQPNAAADLVVLEDTLLLPGFVNAHSHAFQRGLRGLTEFREAGSGRDDFWTWRTKMYALAQGLTPDDLYDVSRQAFLEMVLAGVTSVGEFHYLHHGPDGSRYADVIELERSVLRAASEVGIRVCLLNVAYQRSGFGRSPVPEQQRFIDRTTEEYFRRTEALVRYANGEPRLSIGVAPHSVRAVSNGWLQELGGYAKAQRFIVQMHVAEQIAEVEMSRAETGRTPVERLMGLGICGPQFSAVHALELTEPEYDELAASGATVCACPTTEANLGDGIFDANHWWRRGAPVCIGSDSNVRVDPIEELRSLALWSRLKHRVRSSPGFGEDRHPGAVAAHLLRSGTSHGARALGLSTGSLLPGEWADFVAVDLAHPVLAGWSPETILDSLIFAADARVIREVVVGGEFVVRQGTHPLQDDIGQRYRAWMGRR